MVDKIWLAELLAIQLDRCFIERPDRNALTQFGNSLRLDFELCGQSSRKLLGEGGKENARGLALLCKMHGAMECYDGLTRSR